MKAILGAAIVLGGCGGACADLAPSALLSPTPAQPWLPAGW